MKTSKLLITSLLAAATMGTSAYAGFVWNGGAAIRPDLWQAESSWTLTDGTTWPTSDSRAAGPLTPYSNAWNGVTVANASGTVGTFEGWTLGLTLQNANLTVTTLNKFQGGCTLNLDAASVLSMTLNGSGTLAGNVTVNTEGVFNLALGKTYDGGGFIANLGNGGVMNFTSTGNAFTTKVSQLNATLNTADFDSYTIDANGNTVYTRTLITLGDNVSFDSTNTTVTMTAGAGVGTLTSVEDISGAAAGSYKVTKDSSGYSVSYVVAGTTYAWNATDVGSVWDTSTTNWTTGGGSTSVAFTSGGNVLFGAGETLAKTVAIDSAVTAGTISVADDYTFNVGASGSLSATAVAVAGTKTATLNLAADMELSANLGGSGTLKKTGTGLLTYSGTISSGATLEIASAGTTADPNTFSGTLSAGGNLIVSGGAVVQHTKTTTDGKFLKGNITITGDGSTFIQNGANRCDQLDYNGTTSIAVKDGGTLALGSNRWTFKTNNSLSLDGGNITGSSQSGNGNLDFMDAKTVTVLNSYDKESTISASIRLRNNLTLNVIGDATLNITGKIGNAAAGKKIIKTGTGKMTLDLRTYGDGESAPSENFTGGLDVNGGEVEVRHASALGTGAVTVDGTGSVLDFAVSGGMFTQNQALTTTNGGKITVSAGTLELAGAVNLSNAIEVANGAAVTTSGVKFALSGLTGKANEDGTTTFTLFTLERGAALTWDSLTVENLNLVGSSVAARDATATFDNAAGTVTVSSTAGDLVWNGTSDNSTWNYTATNWKIGDDATAFQNKDNVTFGADAEVKEVTLENGADIRVGNATVEGSAPYTFAPTSGTAKISGTNLTVESGATLTVGNSKSSTVNLAFDDIAVAGTLQFNNGNSTWSSLTFSEGGKLVISDGADLVNNLTISKVAVNGAAEITAGANKQMTIEALSGASSLMLRGSSGWGALKVNINSLEDYSGTLSLVNNTYSVEAVVSAAKLGTTAKIVVGEGTTLSVTAANGAAIDASISNANITGTGIVNLKLGDASYDKTLNLANFSGTTYVSSGCFDIGGAKFGETLKLANNVNFQMGNSSAVTFEKALVLEGMTNVHQNGGAGAKDITFTNSVTGAGTYVKNGGSAATNFEGTVDLGGFTNATAGSAKFTGDTTIGTVSVSNGTVTFSGASTTITTANVTGGVLVFTTDASVDKITGAGAGTIKIESGTVTMPTTDNGQNVLAASLEIGGVSDGNGGYKAAKLTGGFTDQFKSNATNQRIAVKGGGELQVGTASSRARWEIGIGTSISLSNGGVISGLGDAHGALDFNSANTVTATGTGNTISAAVRLRRTGSGDLTFAVNGESSTLLLSGEINPNGEGSARKIIKAGEGTLTVSGVNDSYTAGFEVQKGTLVAAHAKALGTLAVGKSVSVANGAKLQISTLNVNLGTAGEGVVLEQGAKLVIDYANLTPTAERTATEMTFEIMTAAVFSIYGNTLSAGDVTGYMTDAWELLGGDSAWLESAKWTLDGNTLSLTLTIPEPSVFGLLAGLGALALAGTRRRCRKA